MMLLDGKKLAQEIKEDLKIRVANMANNGVETSLAVVLVGDNPASHTYVNMKEKDCHDLGIRSLRYDLPADTDEATLLGLIDQLNADEGVHGILVQLPLPKHLDEQKVIRAIDPAKDVDCFTPVNVGLLATGKPVFAPCTPAGIVRLIKANGLEIAGKDVVIVNRSNIVGKPLMHLMLMENATVTIAHSRTADLKEVCKRADILVAAVGRKEMFDESYVKPGAVVIDVGVNRTPEGKLAGDVAFDKVAPIASAITPCVGGVGPMTRAILMENTVRAAENR
ncbi:MAG: bifunctional 5,10-methylenetetrahydrofolate dehydrogenase/5,10-methenyltetrahydrofolate cyclohydrolase [Clostridia bacterium]|nr:bifunctional 5,10-methylenetetrahydrofolate dehydrogenase/5,10-methenyltetrahydrofolate cyclohydrolase [Clostridia bacterium]